MNRSSIQLIRLIAINRGPKGFLSSLHNILNLRGVQPVLVNQQRCVHALPRDQVQLFPKQLIATFQENDHLLAVVGHDKELGSFGELNETTSDTIDEFVKASKNGTSLEDECNGPLITSLVSEMWNMDEKTLVLILKVLNDFPRPPSSRCPKYQSLWIGLDNALSRKLLSKGNLDLEAIKQMFEVSTLFYKLGNGRFVGFNKNLMNIMLQQLESLDVQCLKQFLFILNLRREPLSRESAQNLEMKILKHIDSFSIDEVSLVTSSLFKTQTQIRNVKLYQKILGKLVENMALGVDPESKSITITSICKELNYSDIGQYHKNEVKNFIRMWDQRRLEGCDPRLTGLLCRMASNYGELNVDLIKSSLKKVLYQDPTAFRLKDLVQILRSCLDFNVRPSDGHFKKMIEIILENPVNLKYPYYFISFVTCLAHFQVFPEPLIKSIRDPRFLRFAEGNYSHDFALF